MKAIPNALVCDTHRRTSMVTHDFFVKRCGTLLMRTSKNFPLKAKESAFKHQIIPGNNRTPL